MTDQPVTIYTDGACRGNPGPGGWGVILSRGKQYKELHGRDPETTNNRTELTAAIKALQAPKRPLPVILYTDSKHLVQGITQWLPKWKAKGWRKADGKPVENADLWKALDESASVHDVQRSWVRSHNGTPGNEGAKNKETQGCPSKGGLGIFCKAGTVFVEVVAYLSFSQASKSATVVRFAFVGSATSSNTSRAVE